MTIYLDNAATSYPKPASVYQMVAHAMKDVGASPGRASHKLAREALSIVETTRKMVAEFFGISNPTQVLFTKNATESINIVLKGWLRPGDCVVTSSIEHNAVMRPLRRLSGAGIKLEIIQCASNGQLDPSALKKYLSPPPRLVVLTHACNVNGTLQPIDEIASFCSINGVPLLLDAAQSGGIQPIDAERWNLGMLACSGHKSLLGPPGVGILYLRPDLDVVPLIEGGTGSLSEEDWQPDNCPDRYESGTQNLPAIAGLAAGIEFIREKGMSNISAHELSLASMLEQGLKEFPGINLFEPGVRGTSAVSFTLERLNPADLGFLLDQGFDIAVRSGLHCAPMAHRTLGSFPEGTVRVSPGFFTVKDEIEKFLSSMESLISKRR